MTPCEYPATHHLRWHTADGVPVLTVPAFEAIDGLKHGISTRLGGVSRGVYDSMDLSFTRGDDPAAVRTNFDRFCRAIGVDAAEVVISAQEHHTVLRRVTEADRGAGVVRPRPWTDVDGLLTDRSHVVLCTQYADCVPLLFVDPVRHVIATSHAGWRGTAARIGAVTVERMCDDYGCRREDILAAIGPSIGACCFEVDRPVAEVFAAMPEGAAAVRPTGKDKFHVDLWEVNRQVLYAAGVTEEHLTVTDLCTRCHPDVFWSHRAAGNQRGSLAVFIAWA